MYELQKAWDTKDLVYLKVTWPWDVTMTVEVRVLHDNVRISSSTYLVSHQNQIRVKIKIQQLQLSLMLLHKENYDNNPRAFAIFPLGFFENRDMLKLHVTWHKPLTSQFVIQFLTPLQWSLQFTWNKMNRKSREHIYKYKRRKTWHQRSCETEIQCMQ